VEVRDTFFIGSYARALDMAAQTSTSNDMAQAEKDAIVARCHLSLKNAEPLKALATAEGAGQKAALFAAMFQRAKGDAPKKAALEKLQELAEASHDANATALYATAMAEDPEKLIDAINVCKAVPSMECKALQVQFMLMLDRADLASKQMPELQRANEDSAVTRLASSQVNIANGNAEEAFLTFCDLETQYADGGDAPSLALLNNKAVANMQRKMFAEAYEDLEKAVALSSSNADVLANMCCCCTHLNKQDEVRKHFAVLEAAFPRHSLVQSANAKLDSAFQRFAANRG